MDAVLTAVAQSAPQLGISGVLITIIVLLIRREAGAEDRHSAELARVTAAHDAELAELRGEITGLRTKIEDLHAAIDLEREQRRKAEDTAALHRRRGASP